MGRAVIDKLELEEGLQDQAEQVVLPTYAPFRTIWVFLEYPDSSGGARLFAILSVFVIVVSLGLFVVETIPSVKMVRNGFLII